MRSRDLAKTTLATLPVALAAPLIGLTLLVTLTRFPRGSVATVFVVIVAGVLLGFLALTRARLPRAIVGAAVGSTAWSLVIGWGVLEQLGTPLVYANTALRCGTGQAMMLIILGPLGLLFTFVVCLGLTAAAASRGFDRALRPAAGIAIAIAGIALAFAASKARRPDTDTYFDSLPLLATLHEGESIVIGSNEYHYVRISTPPSAPENEPEKGEPIPPSYECRLDGVRDAASLDFIFRPSAKEPLRPCQPVQIRVDPVGDLAFAFTSYVPAPTSPTEWTSRIAFRTNDAQAIELPLRLIGDRIAAPLGWRVAGLFGFVSATALLLLARRIRRQAASRVGQEALHRGDGVCELAGVTDEAPIRVPAAASLPLGPVVLYSGVAEESSSTTYRQPAGPSFTSARTGTATTETDLAAGFEAIALSVAVLGATPLLLARLFGI